jgi:hypothetical protein
MDVREVILDRLVACIATVKPGVVFRFPDGRTHRPIESDLGGRVFSKVRSQARTDSTEMPFVEVITSAGTPDSIREVGDENFYTAEMRVEVWGYVKATDQGDAFMSNVRPKLNALRADLVVAIEAFPWWTGPGYPEALVRRVGPVGTVMQAQFTEPATDQPDGFLVIDYAIRYVFDRLDP